MENEDWKKLFLELCGVLDEHMEYIPEKVKEAIWDLVYANYEP